MVDDEYASQSSYTIDLDLPTAGKVSTLWLGVKAKTITTAGETSAFIKYLISSISINQGGQAFLNAAPPEVFEADYWEKTGKFPQVGKHVAEDASENIEEIVPILFGDKVNDPDHYIDLSTLSDPKLSVTYDLASTGPNSGTIWDTTYYPRFTVLGDLLGGVDLPVSKGYYSLRQQASYTPVDSEKHLYELKGTRPIRNIMFQFDRTSLHYGLAYTLANMRIYGDNEAWVPFDLDDRELHLLHRRAHGLCKVTGKFDYIYQGANMDIVTDYREKCGLITTDNQNQAAMIVGGSGRQGPVRAFMSGDAPGGSTETITGYFDFLGLYPWGIYNIDVKKMLGMEYLDPTEHKPVYYEVEHVSNAATIGGPVKIHIQDLVR